MKKPLYIICFAILLAILLFVFAIVGYFVGKNSVKPIIGVTFYANIEEINGDNLLVSGLEDNDINYRGQFYLSVKEDTVLEWRSTEITLENYKIGDTISITCTGDITETYPASIDEVLRIQLLEDEK